MRLIDADFLAQELRNIALSEDDKDVQCVWYRLADLVDAMPTAKNTYVDPVQNAIDSLKDMFGI